ncbi:MAG: hypothetical protein ABR556_12390 [Pyrinomonadaceae bacterium]
MKKKYLNPTILGLTLLAIMVFAAYPDLRAKDNSPSKDFSQKVNAKGYSTDIKQLRYRFNRDKGKVRLLMLLSPT